MVRCGAGEPRPCTYFGTIRLRSLIGTSGRSGWREPPVSTSALTHPPWARIAHGRNNTPAPVVKHLQRGCLSVQRDPDGRVYRHRLRSLAFKGEDAHGVPASWIITAPVARAVAVLERFQPAEQLAVQSGGIRQLHSPSPHLRERRKYLGAAPGAQHHPAHRLMKAFRGTSRWPRRGQRTATNPVHNPKPWRTPSLGSNRLPPMKTQSPSTVT